MAIWDMVLTEVLQGFGSDQNFERARGTLEAVRNFRRLRERGVTIRKTVDTLIAIRCIRNGLPLLCGDRDFDPFVTHLGLVSALK